MSQEIVIDNLEFASQGMSIEGKLPVASLTRVLDKLTESSGFLSYHVQGRLSSRGRVQLLLRLDGILSVCCQRCLEGILFPVEISNMLEMVDNEEDLTQEEIEDDSKDFLPMQEKLDVALLIEDEVLLCLPFAPCHDNCALPVIKQNVEVNSPFSVLKNFKGKAG